MRKKVFGFAIVAFALSAGAVDVFQQQKQSSMGNGSVQPAQQQSSDNTCIQLAQERRAIDQITEKMQWVPIDQQNANYHRMNWLKAQMAARGCSY